MLYLQIDPIKIKQENHIKNNGGKRLIKLVAGQLKSIRYVVSKKKHSPCQNRKNFNNAANCEFLDNITTLLGLLHYNLSSL